MGEIEEMIKETAEISKKLNEKNNEIFTDIVCYFRVSSVEEKECEEIISDVLDMFLRYQEEGKPIEAAIGNDYKAFCDSIIESMSHKKVSLNTVWQNIKMIMSGVFILLTIDLIFNYIPKAIKNKTMISYDFSISFFLTVIIILTISIGIVKYIGKNSFKLSKTKDSKTRNFLFGAGYGLFIVLMGFSSYKLSKYELFSINAYFIFSIIGIYWLMKTYNYWFNSYIFNKEKKSKGI